MSSGKNGKAVVFIVFVALLLDNLLLTSIVPILPNYFRNMNAPHAPIEENNSSNYAIEQETTTMRQDLMEMLQLRRSDGFTETRTIPHFKPSEQTIAPDSKTNATDDKENTKMGLLLGVKTFSQIFCNFFVGMLTNKIGYTIPMFVGFVILLGSTVLFAFANSYWLLFGARAIQGTGTALSTTSGMGLLAVLFPEEKDRAWAQTTAFSGLAAGVLIGPPYGGVLYDWTGGKEIPFLILAGVTLMEGILQLIVIRPRYQPEAKKGSSYGKLFCDPLIFLTILTIMMASLNMAIMEPVLPIWMYHTMGSPPWQQGVAFIPATLAYLVSMHICGYFYSRVECCGVSSRWTTGFIGLMLMGWSIVGVPFCTDIYLLIAPLVLIGIGFALVNSSMLPHIGFLVDRRHEPVYGSAYALTDNAFCFAFAIGPAISGPMVDSVGFQWTLATMATVTLTLSPLVCLLRASTEPPRPRRPSICSEDERRPLTSDNKLYTTDSANNEGTPTTSVQH